MVHNVAKIYVLVNREHMGVTCVTHGYGMVFTWLSHGFQWCHMGCHMPHVQLSSRSTDS